MAKKFYCDETLKKGDKEKTDRLLDYSFRLADQVEFNILYRDERQLTKTIESISKDLVKRGRRFNKIYNGVEFIRFTLTDNVKTFIRTRGLAGWNGTQLEDISFLKGEFEFLATVSHENYIILQMTEDEREEWNRLGFNFVYDCGEDAREERG